MIGRKFTVVILFQTMAVAVLSSAITVATEPYRSWTNALWILGIPFVFGIAFNRTAETRAMACLILVVASVASAVLTAAHFGFGP